MGGMNSFPFLFKIKNKMAKQLSQARISNILGFVKNLVSKSVLRAIEVILQPCCNITAEASVECSSDYTVTITTDTGIGFLGKGIAVVLLNDGTDTYSFTGDVTEPNTILLEDIALSSGTYDATVYVLLPTNSGETIGAYKKFTIDNIVFPSC